MQKRLAALKLLKGPATTIGKLREALASAKSEAGLETLLGECEKLPFRTEVSWSNSGAEGRCDLVFHRGEEGNPALPALPTATNKTSCSLTSDPMHAKLAHELVPEFRSFLQTKLPAYMVPVAFVLLEKLPLTPNGKLDRRALPASDNAEGVGEDSYVAPRTPVEAAVAGIWCEVLRLKQAGVNDNFFDLGGHSLLVTQVVARVRDTFQVELPMRRAFEQPTITATAAAIEDLLVEQVEQLSDDEAHRLANGCANLHKV
jgi:acyl carrier protein